MLKRLRLIGTNLDQECIKTLKSHSDDLSSKDIEELREVVVRKPWGYEYLMADSAEYAVWFLRIQMNSSTSLHCHPKKDTTLVVLSGTVNIETLSDSFSVSEGDVIEIPKGVFHRSSTGSSGVYLIEIETPNDKSDLLRLQDNYGREGTGYENSSSYDLRAPNFDLVELNRLRPEEIVVKYLDSATIRFVIGTLKQIAENYPSTQYVALNLSNSARTEEIIQGGKELQDPFVIIDWNSEKMSCAQAIAESLSAAGITEVFSVVADGSVHLIEAIARHELLNLSIFDEDLVASQAAQGFSRISNLPSALILGGASGALNSVSTIADCWNDSVPLLVIFPSSPNSKYSELASHPKSFNKAVDFCSMVKSISKKQIELDLKMESHSQINTKILEIVESTMGNSKGPAIIQLDRYLLTREILREDLASDAPIDNEDSEVHCLEEDLGFVQLLGDLERYQRIVLLVGDGARQGNVVTLLQEFATIIRIPILLSRSAIDLIGDEFPCLFGRAGAYGQKTANQILHNSDLVISIGCRLGDSFIGRNYEGFLPNTKKYVVDLDIQSKQLQLFPNCDYLEYSSLAFADRLLNEAKNRAIDPKSDWMNSCIELVSNFEEGIDDSKSSEPLFSIYNAMRHFSISLPENTIIISDGGSILQILNKVFSVKTGQRIIQSSGLETIGFALGAAIGVDRFRTAEWITTLVSDHVFNQYFGEFIAGRIPKSSHVIAVFSAPALASGRVVHGMLYPSSEIQRLSTVSTNHVRTIAEIIGAEYYEIDSVESCENILPIFKDLNKPFSVINFKVDPDIVISPRPRYQPGRDGVWNALPLSDMKLNL